MKPKLQLTSMRIQSLKLQWIRTRIILK